MKLRIVFLLFVVLVVGKPYEFIINLKNITGPWNHVWERCVGSGHAALNLRSDFQSHLKKAHVELGFQQIRFHGLFVDDMSVVLPGSSGLRFSFLNIDRIFDYLLSIGMKPFVELSFMPNALASGTKTWSHYNANVTPPKSYDQWADLIIAFAKHLIERYTIDEVRTWKFEVWNEPNCCPHDFWSGSMQDYFHLYSVTAQALKSVSLELHVGGPVTAQSAWIEEFMEYCASNNVTYDFISTHEYPGDPPGPETRTFFANRLKQTREIVGKTPLYYTEYADGYFDTTSYGAAFAIYQNYMTQNIVDILSWWTVSDIFEEGGLYPDPYDQGYVFGLMNVYSIPKPTYRAFQLLHWSGHLLVDTYPNTFNDDNTSVSVFTVIGNNTSIFIVNWNIKKVPVKDANITVTVKGVSGKKRAIIYRIDDENCNSYLLWKKMGSPLYLKQDQVDELNAASELVPFDFKILQISDYIQFTLTIRANAVANIILI